LIYIRFIFYGWFLLLVNLLSAQWQVSGQITSPDNTPVANANIFLQEINIGILSDSTGFFELTIGNQYSGIEISISQLGYLTYIQSVKKNDTPVFLNVILISKEIYLNQIQIESTSVGERNTPQNAIKLNPSAITGLPSAFGDFTKVLLTLPGVSGNNELSTAYSVRGGNFEENLVYVDEIPIYRPFLANSGRQEGLSFVNPDLVKDVSFYAGGWQAKYGDKLSSNLNIEYKEPVKLEGALSLGLLGGQAYFGKSSKNERSKMILGMRYKDARYLLNTLEVNGQYFPKYADIQGLFTFDLTKKSSQIINKTKLNWLISYGSNRYTTFPTSQNTVFGSIAKNYRLYTEFTGSELLYYDTYQTGLKLAHTLNDRYKTNLILSTVLSKEKEYFEIEGAYRLCDVDQSSNINPFDNCTLIRGQGSNFDFGRNLLRTAITTLENRNEWLIDNKSNIEFGFGISYQNISDQLNEYEFIDSADFVISIQDIDNQLDIKGANSFGYLQYSFFSADSMHLFNLGTRINYYEVSDQFLVSPRFQYQYRPVWSVPTRFNFSAGLYSQQPLYRELRDRSGKINQSVQAQKSFQLILGMDQFLTLWGRPFVFTSQAYYKYLWDLNPYDIDNMRIRYYANNSAVGFATGIDFRINGEFIAGTQSWFSLGLLKTMENIENDGRGYIRRPTDQLINLGIFFEDHLANDPSLKVYLNLNIGSGYPFGPPNSPENRNIFSGDEYYRVDLGLTKEIPIKKFTLINDLIFRLEVLNVLAADNTISYSWIEDVNGYNFAIPNSLSARYFNLKLILKV